MKSYLAFIHCDSGAGQLVEGFQDLYLPLSQLLGFLRLAAATKKYPSL